MFIILSSGRSQFFQHKPATAKMTKTIKIDIVFISGRCLLTDKTNGFRLTNITRHHCPARLPPVTYTCNCHKNMDENYFVDVEAPDILF